MLGIVLQHLERLFPIDARDSGGVGFRNDLIQIVPSLLGAVAPGNKGVPQAAGVVQAIDVAKDVVPDDDVAQQNHEGNFVRHVSQVAY